MFGNTVDITIDGTVRTFNKINQDSYGAEFLSRQPGVEYLLKVQHNKLKRVSTEANDAYESHYVKLTATTFATDTAPSRVDESSFTMKHNASNATGTILGAALSGFVTSNATALSNWAI